jgi:hypothetical protein
MKVRIVGLGYYDDIPCENCGANKATVAVTEDGIDEIVVCNVCLGPGQIGGFAELREPSNSNNKKEPRSA